MSAYRVAAPVNTPFFRERRPKAKKKTAAERREKEEPGYLAKIRRLPCCIPGCDAPPQSQAHHLKCVDPARGKGTKPSNRWCVPLCHEHHINGVERVGSRRECSWFLERGIFCIDLAGALYLNSHSFEAMLRVLNTCKGTKT